MEPCQGQPQPRAGTGRGHGSRQSISKEDGQERRPERNHHLAVHPLGQKHLQPQPRYLSGRWPFPPGIVRGPHPGHRSHAGVEEPAGVRLGHAPNPIVDWLAAIDSAMIDIIGHADTIRDVYHLDADPEDGETDRDLCNLFYQLNAEQIAGYLFSFNPEPGTATQDLPRQPIHRHRRIQLVKYLIENDDLPGEALSFDEAGSLIRLTAPAEMVNQAIDSGLPFMTNGCPNRHGVMACNRPYDSYRPGEEYRDYPFQPEPEDVAIIRQQMRLEEIWSQSAMIPA